MFTLEDDIREPEIGGNMFFLNDLYPFIESQLDEENNFRSYLNEGNNNYDINRLISPMNDETNNSSKKDTKSQSKLKIENKYINYIQKNNYITKNNQNEKEFIKEHIEMKKELHFYLSDKIDCEIKNEKEKKFVGRKRNNPEKMGKHNKFSDDNVIQKVKQTLISNVYNHINKTLEKKKQC